MKKAIFSMIAIITMAFCTSNFTFSQETGGEVQELQIDCNCYYRTDCSGDDGRCDVGTSCTKTLKSDAAPSDPPSQDGNCVKPQFVYPINPSSAAMALKHWLLAYEKAGETGGGYPDPTLINVAKSFEFSPENHLAVRDMAIYIVTLYTGLTSYVNIPHKKGYFKIPSSEEGMENGYIESLPDEVIKAGRIIREAFTEEVTTKGEKGIYAKKMQQLRIAVPEYASFGRCEFPHPSEHHHEFIYQDGFDCLTQEIHAGLNQVLLAIDKANLNKKECPIFKFEIVPNPVTDEGQIISIIVEIPQCGKKPKDIIIRDVFGNMLLHHHLQDGINTITVKGSDLNNNRIYRCEILIANQVVESKNLIIIK